MNSPASRPSTLPPRLAALVIVLACARVAVGVPTSTATFTATTTPTLRINELLTQNTRIANAGTFPDMIELFNAGTATIDLSGKRLRDDAADPNNPRIFTFPAGATLAGGAYLVVYADANTSAPGLHTGFALDSEGDELRLHESVANGGALIDSIKFGFQVADYSLSRTGAASNVWALTTPTLGAANGNPVLLGSSPEVVRINEWAGKITFRLDHDMIEFYNTATLPVALGGVRLTDDITRPTRFVFPVLSFIGPNGFLPLYGADFGFGLDGDADPIHMLGENNERIDNVQLNAQPRDVSSGRNPDGSATVVNFTVPTPGMPNATPLPTGYAALLENLRITELMYEPAAPNSSSDYEFVELQNIGATTLDLSGVRFTNGLDYTFPAGTTLAPGAFKVVAKNRAAFLSRYPSAASVLATDAYIGALDNTGETLALTLPAPWYVHILRFRFETDWFTSASGGGHSIVVPAPATTPPQDWEKKSTWRQSTATGGSPGAAEGGTVIIDTTARLSNLSVRTTMAASQTLIVGFVVSGGPRIVLVRAAGPALTAFGLAGAMTDPRLELYNGSTLVFENDNWPVSLADTFTSVGAFSFGAGSRDAAFVQSIDGARSIQARGTGPGVVLVEAYDTGSGNTPRLINVSARNRVGTGDDILIAGFNIAGTGNKQLLIRAVGPKLAAFGVTGFLVNPKLEVYTGAGTKLTENDDWAAALATTFTAVGAFLLDTGSRDAALLTTLAPGSYTVQVRGADGGTGEGLVEIYEVP